MSDFTKKLTGVEHSRDASVETREVMREEAEEAFIHGEFVLEHRLRTCSECHLLKEEFKMFGVTIKDKTPTCGECGCNLNLKTKLDMFSCPIGLW